MLPPVTTRQLQRAIEMQRRAEATERWTRSMAVAARLPGRPVATAVTRSGVRRDG